MALDPIQRSPYEYYPSVVDAGGGLSKQFNEGYGSAQTQEANRIAMDTAQQAQRTNDQLMRLRDAEERRKQLLFQQSQGDRANSVAAFAALAKGGTAPQAGSPSLNFNPLVMQPAVPQANPSSVGGGNEFPSPAPAPGPQAAYNPEADLPGVRANIAQQVNPSNAPGGFYIPNGSVSGLPQFAVRNNPELPATAQTGWNYPITPSRRPGSMDSQYPYQPAPEAWQGTPMPHPVPSPNMSAAQEAEARLGRSAQTNTDVNNIVRNITQTVANSLPGDLVLNPGFVERNREATQYTSAQQAQNDITRANANKVIDFYRNPEVQAYLKSDPALAQFASRNPLAFYQQNAASMMATPGAAAPAATPTAAQQPITVAGADGKPVSINVSTGQSDPNQLGADNLSGVGLNRGMTQAPTVLPPPAVKEEVQKVVESETPAVFKLAAFDERTRKAQSDIEYYTRMRDFAARTRNGQVFFEADKNLRNLQFESSVIGQERAVIAFNMGDAAPLAKQIAEIGARSGFQIQLQQNQDGSFNVIEGGKVVNKNVSRKDLSNTAASMFDFTRKQQEAAMTALNAEMYKRILEKSIDTNAAIRQKKAELEAETARDTTKIFNENAAKIYLEMQKEGYKGKEQDIQIQLDPNNPNIAYIHDKKNLNRLGVVNLEDEKDPKGNKTGRKLPGKIQWF